MKMTGISVGSMKGVVLLKGHVSGTYHMFALSKLCLVSRLARRNRPVRYFQPILSYQGVIRNLLYALLLGLVLLLGTPNT